MYLCLWLSYGYHKQAGGIWKTCFYVFSVSHIFFYLYRYSNPRYNLPQSESIRYSPTSELRRKYGLRLGNQVTISVMPTCCSSSTCLCRTQIIHCIMHPTCSFTLLTFCCMLLHWLVGTFECTVRPPGNVYDA